MRKMVKLKVNCQAMNEIVSKWNWVAGKEGTGRATDGEECHAIGRIFCKFNTKWWVDANENEFKPMEIVGIKKPCQR